MFRVFLFIINRILVCVGSSIFLINPFWSICQANIVKELQMFSGCSFSEGRICWLDDWKKIIFIIDNQLMSFSIDWLVVRSMWAFKLFSEAPDDLSTTQSHYPVLDWIPSDEKKNKTRLIRINRSTRLLINLIVEN